MPSSAVSTAAHLRLTTGFDSRITEVDPAFSRVTGWPAEEAVGQTVAILFGPWSDRSAVDRITRAVEQGNEQEPLPVRVYGYAGNVFDALISVAPDGQGGVECVVGEAMGFIASAPVAIDGGAATVVPPAPERLLPILMDALHDGVAVVDEEQRIVAANAAFARMTGIDADELIGTPVDKVLELRFPPGEREPMGAAIFTGAAANARSAAVRMSRGIDHRGRPFRVMALRASAANGPRPPDAPLGTRMEIFEQTLLKKVERDHMPVAVGLLEIVADDEIARNLGSIWRDTLERARLAAVGALSGELRPGELFAAVRSDTVVVLLLASATVEDALARMHAIAQIARHRLVGEGGAVAALEAFGAAIMVDADDQVVTAPRGNAPGVVVERLVELIRGHQDGEHQIETIIADVLDEGTAAFRSVRGRDLGPARQVVAGFDDRSERWIAWIRKRHLLSPSLRREFDVALLGRVVEQLLRGEKSALSIMVPVGYDSLLHTATADRLSALASSLPPAARVRLFAIVGDLPPEIAGDRLQSMLHRIKAFCRGAWITLNDLDARGVTGRQDGLAGFVLESQRLGKLIERDPLIVRQFIERLRATNNPVLVSGVESTEQARLYLNAMGATLAIGPGVERLAANPNHSTLEI